MDKNIVLIGFMGSGKTTVGTIAGRELCVKFMDTDDIIVDSSGMEIKDIFAQKGEGYFRLLEKEAVKTACRVSGCVISCGGGVVKNPENVRNLKENGIIICLKAGVDAIIERIGNDDTRPLIYKKSRDEIIKLMQQRKVFDNSAADAFIDTSDMDTIEVARSVIDIYKSHI